jgi:Sec7-like guanine-nucleotide exchange factor
MEIGDTKIFVPEGFVGHLPTYTDALKSSAEHASKVVSDVLVPYNTFLSQLLSSDNARLASIGQLGYLSKFDARREELNKWIGDFFRKGSTQVKQPMKDVFSRNAEWETVLFNQNDATKEIGKVDRKSVQSMVDQCVELIEAVKASAESGELDNLSGPMIKQLAASAMSVANEVTFYSITLYRVNGMDKIINDSIDILTEELKK